MLHYLMSEHHILYFLCTKIGLKRAGHGLESKNRHVLIYLLIAILNHWNNNVSWKDFRGRTSYCTHINLQHCDEVIMAISLKSFHEMIKS